jgi:hypothetical protein
MERGSARPGRMAWAAGTLLGALAFGLPVSVSAQGLIVELAHRRGLLRGDAHGQAEGQGAEERAGRPCCALHSTTTPKISEVLVTRSFCRNWQCKGNVRCDAADTEWNGDKSRSTADDRFMDLIG